MRLHFGFICLTLVSTLALAQTNPVSPTSPNRPGVPQSSLIPRKVWSLGSAGLACSRPLRVSAKLRKSWV